MKKKIYGALIVSLVSAGCATASGTSRIAIVKPTASDSTEWAIYAKSHNGAFSDQISIYINEKEVANGVLSVTQTRNNFSGVFEGRKIDAECSTANDGGMTAGHKCVIYIDSKQTSELSF